MKIRGVNLGGWLLMESYILHGRNIGETFFKRAFENKNGRQALKNFEKKFRDTFITEKDFKNISAMGANTVRVPFNHKLVEPEPFRYSKEGLQYLLKALNWAQKYKLKIILDLHAAPGAQNWDWHGDCEGDALFWKKEIYRERTLAIWDFIADSVKDHPALHGYDVVNEPVLGKTPEKVLSDFYKKAIRRIKAIDKKHTIYLEGHNWAQNIDFLADILDDGVAVSIHNYLPLYYTFNLVPNYHYPGVVEGEKWNKNTILAALKPYHDFAKKNNVEIFVGEFGITWRGGRFGELIWLNDILSSFSKYGFGCTYWTYKAVANTHFPDGIYQYLPNTPFVKREGPVYGFETYIDSWKKDKNKIIDTWKTSLYSPNKPIIGKLRENFRRG